MITIGSPKVINIDADLANKIGGLSDNEFWELVADFVKIRKVYLEHKERGKEMYYNSIKITLDGRDITRFNGEDVKL